MPIDASQWLTTSQASAALGVAPKTVRRRIERGELEARKASRDGGGIGWLVKIGGEVDIVTTSEVDTKHPSKDPRNGQRNAHTEGVMDSETPIVKDSERVSDLRDEVKFLRGVIEQLQRDGAETRAALREALKSKAPQLTAGDLSAHSGTDLDAHQSARKRHTRDEMSATNNVTNETRDAVKSAPNARQSGAIDYGAIADLIEGK